MDINGIINFISNLGFPITVASYLLFRFERKLDSLSSAISELSKGIDNFKE